MNFEKNLKELRIKANFTQEQLAKKINISLRTYQGWEIAKSRPKYEILEKLKEILDCTYDDLLK